MKIGELAKRAGVSVSTVRFYERQGLMPKPETRESGYREYANGDLDRLRLIVAAKRQRFPLRLIEVMLHAVEGNEEPCIEIASVVRSRLETIAHEIRELQNLHARLKTQLDAWERDSLPKTECLCAILQTDALTPITTGENNDKQTKS